MTGKRSYPAGMSRQCYFVIASRCIISSIELNRCVGSRRLQRGWKCVAPGHRARIHAGGFRGFDVADLVADADRLRRFRAKLSCDAPKFPVLAEHRSTAVEAGDQAGGGSEHLPDGGFAVGTDDGGLDAVALQVGQHRRDAGEQRYLACRGELALSHVADDGRQLPHGYVEPCHDFARGQAAHPFHLVVADGRKIEPRDHVLEGGAKPWKGIGQRTVEVENGEAIVGHEIRPSAGHLSSPPK